jgi:hypothetical protein
MAFEDAARLVDASDGLSQAPMSWSKAPASKNISYMVVTFDVSHVLMWP